MPAQIHRYKSATVKHVLRGESTFSMKYSKTDLSEGLFLESHTGKGRFAEGISSGCLSITGVGHFLKRRTMLAQKRIRCLSVEALKLHFCHNIAIFSFIHQLQTTQRCPTDHVFRFSYTLGPFTTTPMS